MNSRSKILAIITAGTAGALSLVTPQLARADYITEIGFSVFQYAGYYISYVVSIIGLIVFAIESYFLQLVLDMNFQIVNSLSVQFGFSIVLAFANIFFVAAVIIMAVATIVRYEAYGAKQLLWRIVIAAVGVNFSLILAGTVINFSDQMTKYFMNASVPNPGASTGADAFGSGGFVDNLAGAFNPQKMMLSAGISTSTKEGGDYAKEAFEGLQKTTGAFFGALAGILMTAAMVVLMAIFFGALLAAFVVRYVMLTLLLTIMPAVWLAWVFPFGRSLLNWWKDKFVKYTFFAPMAMFFLYLSMRSIAFLNSAHVLGDAGVRQDQADLTGKGLSGFLYAVFGKNLMEGLISQAFNFVLVAGTLYGGLYYSSKLGIKAASSGANMMQSFGNSVKRRTIDRAKTSAQNSANRTLDRIRTAGKNAKGDSWLKQKSQSLMQVGSKDGVLSKAAKYTGIGAASRALASSVAAAGTVDKDRADARVKEYSGNFKNLTNEALLKERERLASGSLLPNADYDAALFKELKERKELGGLAKPMSRSVAKELEEFRKNTPDATKAELKSEEKRLREKHKDEEEAYKASLEKQLKRAKDSGVIKDIKSAAPRLAALAPKDKTKDKLRDQTDIEAIASAVGSVKVDDDAIQAIVHDSDMFSVKENADLAVLSTLELKGGHVKKFVDMNAETTENVIETLQYIEERLDQKHADFDKYFYDSNSEEWKGLTPDQIKERTKNRVSLSVARARAKALRGSLKNVNALAEADDKKNERGAPQPVIEVMSSKPPRSVTTFN